MRRSTTFLLFVLSCLPAILPAQVIRFAEMSLSQNHVAYPIIATTVAQFDIVAAEEVGDAGRMEKVLGGMDEGWEAVMSGAKGFFGFFYNARVELVNELGAYPGKNQFSRPPYGAQFRLVGSRFMVNLVVCSIPGGKAGAAETSHLAEVYRYFERLTGNRGITILAGRFGSGDDILSMVSKNGSDVTLVKGKGLVTASPVVSNAGLLASASLGPQIQEAGVETSALHPIYAVLREAK